MRGEPFVLVRRGEIVESVHHVAACAVDANGQLLLALGDTDSPFYLRSAAKPFIASTAIEAGVVERFGLERHEIAVMAASHNGEAFHIEAVRSILRKIGLDEEALRCGPHLPYDAKAAEALLAGGETPQRIHNNCSGKHAGILALCRVLNSDVRTYLDPANPAQQRILRTCAALSGDPSISTRIGVDGCGIPAYATSLRYAATSYMRLATLRDVGEGLARALQIVREAMMAYPEYVSGTGEFDAALMRTARGSIVCKGGAEGVHGNALIDAGIGLVVKIIDGAERARPPAALALIERLGALSPAMRPELAPFAHPAVRNRAGLTVGEITTIEAA
jgi:L-asparaginase II